MISHLLAPLVLPLALDAQVLVEQPVDPMLDQPFVCDLNCVIDREPPSLTDTPAGAVPDWQMRLSDHIAQFWNTGSLSPGAQQMTIVVTVTMTPDGSPARVALKSYGGGDEQTAGQLYESARRAIMRALAAGFDLPADQFAVWQVIDMTFNASTKRIR